MPVQVSATYLTYGASTRIFKFYCFVGPRKASPTSYKLRVKENRSSLRETYEKHTNKNNVMPNALFHNSRNIWFSHLLITSSELASRNNMTFEKNVTSWRINCFRTREMFCSHIFEQHLTSCSSPFSSPHVHLSCIQPGWVYDHDVEGGVFLHWIFDQIMMKYRNLPVTLSCNGRRSDSCRTDWL